MSNKSTNNSTKGFSTLIIAFIIIGGTLLIAPVLWGIGVLFAQPHGQGEAYKDKHSAENWTSAQADFEERFAGIKAADANIGVAWTALQADPQDKTLQTNYTGAKTNCNNFVAAYDALARSYLAEEFRAADLPAQIDITDPLTDCKEGS